MGWGVKIQEESSISTCIVQEVDVTTPRLCCIENEKKADSLWKAYRPVSGRLLLCNNNKDNNSDNNDVINKVTNLNVICYLTILWSQNYIRPMIPLPKLYQWAKHLSGWHSELWTFKICHRTSPEQNNLSCQRTNQLQASPVQQACGFYAESQPQ